MTNDSFSEVRLSDCFDLNVRSCSLVPHFTTMSTFHVSFFYYYEYIACLIELNVEIKHSDTIIFLASSLNFNYIIFHLTMFIE